MQSTLLRGWPLLALLLLAVAWRADIHAPVEPGAAAATVPAEASPRPAAAEPLSPSGDETASPPPARSPTETSTPVAASATPAPEWLGSHVLAGSWSDIAAARETPAELRDRRLITPDGLPAPDSDKFRATVEAVPETVAARSTWRPDCPVGLEELRYATVTFWGFDGASHTGEFIANAAVADDLVWVFERLHEVRFPVEEMRVIAAEELDGPRTGDGNVTTVFVCRHATQSSSWSQHAYGLAIDINPFHNPYLKGDVVRPEFATAYTDRDWVRSGMITRGDPVTEAFAEIGWAWGGEWNSLKDWMHFSFNGR